MLSIHGLSGKNDEKQLAAAIMRIAKMENKLAELQITLEFWKHERLRLETIVAEKIKKQLD